MQYKMENSAVVCIGLHVDVRHPRLSVVARTTELGGLAGCPIEDLAPLMALRRREKAKRHCSQQSVVL